MTQFYLFKNIFQISFNFFRRTTYLFLTILITYASLVLIALYSYQFSSIPEIFGNLTHIPKEWTDDIGLEQFDNAKNSTL